MKQKTKNLNFVFFGVVCLLFTACEKSIELPPEGFAVQVVLSSDVLHVGDSVTLTLKARHPVGSVIHFPAIGKGKEIVVLGRFIDTKERTEEILETEEINQITSFRIGDWAVTTNPVVCIFADGRERKQALRTLILRVQSVLNETNASKLSDINGPINPPIQLPRWTWVFVLIVLIALLAGIITLLLRKKTEAASDNKPIDSPHVIALKALRALREKKWISEPFFVQLSLILRIYLENRFDLNAPEFTTEELAGKLQHDPRLNENNRQTLREFFIQADLVKFARADAEQEVMQHAFSTVEKFVDQTKEKILEPQKNEKKNR